MLKIYANLVSSPCRRVLYVANYLELDYELIELEFRSPEMRGPEYRQIHPLGKVPALEDGDFRLFESGAMCKYLCRKVDSPLFPQEIHEQAIMLQWEDFCLAHVGLAMGKVMFNRTVVQKYGIAPDERSIADGLKWLRRYLPLVERQLSKGRYLCGDQLTLADMSLLATLDAAEDSGVELTPYEALTRWRYHLQGQDFWVKVG